LVAAAALVLAALVPSAQAVGLRKAAATENDLASRAAVQIMQSGGNAIDAAVTAALMGGVVSPTSSGIGGGGFAVVWLAKERRAVVLDFRETAPAGIDVAAFEARPFSDAQRGKYTGVPGEVRGLSELHSKFGKKAWKDVVAPAAQTAKQGFAVSRFLAGSLAANEKRLRIDPALSRVFYTSGKPPATGTRVTRPNLAKTLELIAATGPAGFYEGAVARDIVATNRSVGGALTMADLAAYRPMERAPLHVSWEGHDVYTMPPPSAGGLMVVQTLGLFKKAELKRLGRESGAYQHLLAEAMRGAIADRMRHIGDPDHAKFDLAKLNSAKRLATRRARIAVDRTHTLPRFGLEEHGTHHLVTSDSEGNVVALTTTVNRTFGAKVVADKSGVVLNDQLDDFTAVKDVGGFGMKQSPNQPRPGARPVSSMTPTIVVKDDKAVLALGGSGGVTIATNVTQLLVSSLVFDLPPQTAVKIPRFQIPPRGPTILLEAGASQALRDDLAFRGEIVGTVRFTQSAVQMISLQNGQTRAASDPRKHGTAVVR
jgi:gamma-glutamyltranspeptidase/glutathione hydrolase